MNPYLKAARQDATCTGAVVPQHYFSKNSLDVKPHTWENYLALRSSLYNALESAIQVGQFEENEAFRRQQANKEQVWLILHWLHKIPTYLPTQQRESILSQDTTTGSSYNAHVLQVSEL